MSIKEFVEIAKQDETVYISDVENSFNKLVDKTQVYIVLDLIDRGVHKDFSFYLPSEFGEVEFVEDYFFGKIYNILSTLGGTNMSIYYDMSNDCVDKLVKKLDVIFGISFNKKQRKGYARAINVTDRMIEALFGGKFYFSHFDIKDKPSSINKKKNTTPKLKYKAVVDGLNGLMCGIDIGGTDIKLALSIDNDIICFKEYDWYPASHDVIAKTIDPILLLVRLFSVKATFAKYGGEKSVALMLERALAKDAQLCEIKKCVDKCEEIYLGKLELFDGIGMCVYGNVKV